MSENRYPCPECGAVLRPKNPVAPGKKIRCPKCEAVFAPAAEETPKPAAKKSAATKKPAVAAAPKPKAKPAGDDDEEEGGSYSFAEEGEEGPKHKVEYGSLRDKFAKSARGPAMAKCTIPANWMMFFSIAACLGYIVMFCVGFWPLVFTSNPTKEYYSASVIWAVILMPSAVLGFVLNALVMVGMFKMTTLESQGWAWTGAILGLLFNPFAPISTLIAIWVIITLNDPEVKAGFAEKKPNY